MAATAAEITSAVRTPFNGPNMRRFYWRSCAHPEWAPRVGRWPDSTDGQDSSAVKIDFFFDPTCPWCWITSRWIAEVAPPRDLAVRWRTFSLAWKNHDPEDPPSDRARPYIDWSTEALRVSEAVRAEVGEAAVGDFYAQTGYRFHNDGERFPDLAGALVAAGLPSELAGAASHDAWDRRILASMGELEELGGDDIGVPSVVFDGEVAFFGPVMTPAPTGREALDLWDGLVTIARTGGFYELKRSRTVGPEFRPRR